VRGPAGPGRCDADAAADGGVDACAARSPVLPSDPHAASASAASETAAVASAT